MVSKNGYEFHPVADIFPMMEGAAYAELVADIREHGLRDSILLAEGKIADGRNRYQACIEAEVQPRFERWDKKGSLVALVLSRNAHRRHLDRNQLAIAAAKSIPLFAEEAEKRQKAGVEAPVGAKGKAADFAALQAGAATRTVERAKQVIDKGAPELVQAVEAGKVTVADAAAIVDQPKDEQRKAVKAVQEGKAKTVKAAVQKAKPEPELSSGASDGPRVDAVGVVIPKKLHPAFDEASAFDSLNRELNGIGKQLEELSKVSPFLHLQTVQADIGNIKRAVKFAKPYAVCGYCKGKGCEACKNGGWVPKNIYESTPE